MLHDADSFAALTHTRVSCAIGHKQQVSDTFGGSTSKSCKLDVWGQPFVSNIALLAIAIASRCCSQGQFAAIPATTAKLFVLEVT